MIYIDPPYGIKFCSNRQASVRKRDITRPNLRMLRRHVTAPQGSGS